MARRRRREDRLAPTESRKHLLRERRVRRDRQMLLAVLGPILVIVILMLGYGSFRELYQIPRSPVARVNGETITGATFRARLQWERRQLLSQLDSMRSMLQSSDPSLMAQVAGQQRGSVPQSTLDLLIDEALIRQEAIKRGIEVTVADIEAKIHNDLATAISPGTSPTAVVTTTASVTATGAVSSTATPIPTEAIGEAYETYIEPALAQTGLSLSEYRDVVVRPQVYREKLSEAMGKEVAITDKQVEVAYLLFESDETAKAAADALAAGEGWDDVALRYGPPDVPEEEAPVGATPEAPATSAITGTTGSSVTATGRAVVTGTNEVTDTGAAAVEPTSTATPAVGLSITGTPTDTLGAGALTPTTGLTATVPITPTAAPTATPEPFASEAGEREWMTRQAIIDRWTLSETDADKVMALGAGEASGPLPSGRGKYVAFVFAVDESRPLAETELESRRAGALDKWLVEEKKTAAIDRFPTEPFAPPEPTWFTDYYNSIIGAPQPTLDIGGLSVSTTVPGAAPPAAGATAAP